MVNAWRGFVGHRIAGLTLNEAIGVFIVTNALIVPAA